MKEKTLIRYVRKSKTIMAPAISVSVDDETIYRKENVYYPCGVLVCVCRNGLLYFGWSYISNMAREGVQVGQGFFKAPSFVKKTAVKIAMDKINGRAKVWTKDDMPVAVRKEFDSFASRAIKYFKTGQCGNYAIRRSSDEKSANTDDS